MTDLTVTGNLYVDQDATISGATTLNNVVVTGRVEAPSTASMFPGFTFTGDIDTGLHNPGQNQVAFTAGGLTALTASPWRNVSMCGYAATSYGDVTEGQRVVYFPNVDVTPEGLPNGGSGGIIYVDGNQLHYLNASGEDKDLTFPDVKGPALATHESIVRYIGPSGKEIQDSAVLISDDGAVLVPDGTVAEPTITFVNDASSGLSYAGSGIVALSASGAASMYAMPNSNTVFGISPPTNFGATTEGEGVVFVNPVQVVPDGVPNSGGGGGLMFVQDDRLRYMGQSGMLSNLTFGAAMVAATNTTPAAAGAMSINTVANWNLGFDAGGSTFDATTGSWVVPQTGLYSIDVVLQVTGYTQPPAATSGFKAMVVQNMVTVLSWDSRAFSDAWFVVNMSGVVALTAGDTVQVMFNPEDACTVCSASPGSTSLRIYRVE